MTSPNNLGTARAGIEFDTSSLTRMQAVVRNVANDVTRSFGRIDAAAKRTQADVQRAAQQQAQFGAGLGSALGITPGGLAAGLGVASVAQLARTSIELAKSAAQAERVRQSFDDMAASAGEGGDRMLASMQRASRGMISDSQLILTANRAMLLGVADSSEEMAKLLEIARVRGQAAGLTFEEAFNRLALGIGKLEIEILDELGLAVKLLPIYERTAAALGKRANQLTETEKRQALFNDIVRQSEPLLAQAGNRAESNADKFEKFAASIENAKQQVGLIVVDSGLADWLDDVGRKVLDATTRWREFREAVQRGRTQGDVGVGLRAIGGLEPDERQIVDIRGNIRFLERMQAGLQQGLTRDGAPTADLQNNLRDVNTQLAQFRAQLALATDAIPTRSNPGGFGAPTGARAGAAAGFTADELAKQRAERISFAQDLAAVDRSAAQDRLEATRDYEGQRSETIASYERTIAREAQDFARQRARDIARFNDQIGDLQRDAAKRETDWLEDLNERIADATADTNERIADATEETNKRVADIERDYQRDRERSERDHRDRLLDAAARLDAQAVYNEQRSFARSEREAEEARNDARQNAQDGLQEQIQAEREQLAERIAQEEESHQERLQDAREADAERLAEMTEAFAEQQQLEDEDRAIRLQRMAEDQAAQLAQMDSAHQDRLQQIDQHAAEERKTLTDAHLRAMEALGITVNDAWTAIQDAIEASMLASYDKFTQDLAKRYAMQGAMTQQDSLLNQWPKFSDPSSWVSTTPPSVRGSSTSTSLTVAPGAIQVFAAPGQSAQSVAEAVREEMARVFRELTH